MAVSAPALHDALTDIVGRAHVLRDASALAAYAVDDLAPSAVVRPDSAEQVCRVLALCAAERLAVVARGAGTSQGLGNPPRRLDLVLDLHRLAAVREYVPEDMVATVGAGVTLDALAARLAPHRQIFALDPPGGGSRTVGGVLASHASGPLRFRYGTGRDLLLGVRFVQADGTLTWGGAKVVKSVTGYDVPKLMVGALGTLGVLAELTLRLHSLPDVERTWLVALPSAAAAQTLVGAILDSTLQPNRIELLDEAALRAETLPPSPLAALVSFGSVEDAVAEQGARLARLAVDAGGQARAVAGEWTSGEDRTTGDARTTLRVGSLPGRLASTFETLRRALARVDGARSTMTAHAGLGLWHVTLDGGGPDRIATLVEELRQAVGEHDGYVAVTGGPASVRRRVDPWGPIAPDAFALMRAIKSTFDPDGRLNPGRFVSGL
jgi:glycolate oxidase FAD binding subunit